LLQGNCFGLIQVLCWFKITKDHNAERTILSVSLDILENE
jgi:hypothetical protein